MNASRREWSRDELVLALDLHSKLGAHVPDVHDADVAGLSYLLGDLAMNGAEGEGGTAWSRAAIIQKLSVFRALDAKGHATSRRDLSKSGALENEIWAEFAKSPSALAREADAIRRKLRSAPAQGQPLRANLHVLRLLGDELIGSPRLAVFELVKNAYDADAKNVTVRLDLDAKVPAITVRDDGSGMSLNTIRDGWLQIGSPLKRATGAKRTPKYGRLPLGEKGVGRLAAFKLGNRLEVTTREKRGTEYRLVMDLNLMLGPDTSSPDSSVEDVRIRVRTNEPPAVFSGEKAHGTEIRVTHLRPEWMWQRRELRDLQRMLNSLASPFQEIGDFSTALEVPGRADELSDLPDSKSLLERAMWAFDFDLDENARFTWEFRFNPPPVFKGLNARVVSSSKRKDGERLEKVASSSDAEIPQRPPRESLFYSASDLEGIGPLAGRFYVFDLRSAVTKHLGTKAVKLMLEAQSGVRVYRDGIRVFNYGEPGNDWLELNISRVNRPGTALATNSVVGAVHLTRDGSVALREKTNREGFDENHAFEKFKGLVGAIVEHLNVLRQSDRKDIDALLSGGTLKEDASTRFRKAVDEVLAVAEGKGLAEQVRRPMDRIVKEYDTLRDVVASSGAGLNIAVVFHEVEREVRALARGLEHGDELNLLKARAEHLTVILDGFGSLLKKATRKTMPISALIKRAAQLSAGRFRAHKIAFSCPVLEGGDEDFDVSGALNFYITTLMNLLDNSIYWVRRRAELEGKGFHRAIHIRTLRGWAAEGPALAVIDNGPGFSISAEEAMRPYASTRPGGMGLGLYFAKTAMDANGGDLLIPDSIADLDLDTKLDGAAVVMRFKEAR